MNISGSRVIHIVIVLRFLLPSIWTLLFILKAGFVSKVKLVSANSDAILVAIKMRINTIINEGN